MIQHVVVIAIVGLCLAYIAKQVVATLRLGKGNLGSCCSKGCSAAEPQQTPKAQFLPADLLVRKR